MRLCLSQSHLALHRGTYPEPYACVNRYDDGTLRGLYYFYGRFATCNLCAAAQTAVLLLRVRCDHPHFRDRDSDLVASHDG